MELLEWPKGFVTFESEEWR